MATHSSQEFLARLIGGDLAFTANAMPPRDPYEDEEDDDNDNDDEEGPAAEPPVVREPDEGRNEIGQGPRASKGELGSRLELRGKRS